MAIQERRPFRTPAQGVPGAAPPPDPDKPPRRLRLDRYKSFRPRTKSVAPAYEDRAVSTSFKLFRRSLRVLFKHWKLFGAITLMFGFLNFTLVGGFVDPTLLQNASEASTNALGDENASDSATGLGLLAVLMTSSTSSLSNVVGAYQILLFFVTSLALIWALRQVTAGRPAAVRSAFYQGPATLVPVLLVVAVLLLEMVPFLLGGGFFISLMSGGIAKTFLEQGLAVSVFFLLTLVSLYWLCASIFAVFIVTLPRTAPIQALRSANELVRYRRFLVLRKLIFLALIYAIIGIFLIVPVALVSVTAAPPLFFGLSMLALPVGLSYLYNLYRELIG